MPVRAVIFDIGDTLWRLDPLPADLDRRMADAIVRRAPIDAPRAVALVRAALAAARGIVADGRNIEPDIAETILWQAGAAGIALPRPAAVAAAEALGSADIGRLISRPEPAAVLARLRGLGLRVGLLSNTWTPTAMLRAFVEREGALVHVQAATFSSAEGLRKPHPDLYGRALQRLRVDAADALFVGDRVYEDVLGPQAVGMRAALSHEHRQDRPRSAHPEAVIGSLREVIDLVLRLNSASDG